MISFRARSVRHSRPGTARNISSPVQSMEWFQARNSFRPFRAGNERALKGFEHQGGGDQVEDRESPNPHVGHLPHEFWPLAARRSLKEEKALNSHSQRFGLHSDRVLVLILTASRASPPSHPPLQAWCSFMRGFGRNPSMCI